MPIYITVALALIPSLLLVRFFQLHDAFPEPPRQIWMTFFLGALTIFPVLLLTYPLMQALPLPENPFLRGLFISFVFAAIPEEFFKLLVLTRYSFRHRVFDEPMDGIVYGAVVGQGFAAFENVLYSVSGGAGIAIGRALTAVPAHACMGVIMGYYVGKARFDSENRAACIFKGFLFAVLVHGFYNTPLLTMQSMMGIDGEFPPGSEGIIGALMLGTLCVLLGSIIWSLGIAHNARKAQINREVPPPIPSPPDLPKSPGEKGGPSYAFGLLTVLWGLVLSACGGAMTSGGLRTVFSSNVDGPTYAIMLAALLVLGIFPLISGLVLFNTGVRRINEARRASAEVQP